METSIPALVIGAILMVSTVLLARTGYSSFDDLGQSWHEMEVRAGEQARTRLSVVSAGVDGTGALVTVTLRNDGQTSIADYRRMDLVVQYEGDDASYHILWLPYVDGAPGDNEWTVQAISGDVLEPGILNTGETIAMDLKLSPAMAVASTGAVIVSTELGVSVSAYFTR